RLDANITAEDVSLRKSRLDRVVRAVRAVVFLEDVVVARLDHAGMLVSRDKDAVSPAATHILQQLIPAGATHHHQTGRVRLKALAPAFAPINAITKIERVPLDPVIAGPGQIYAPPAVKRGVVVAHGQVTAVVEQHAVLLVLKVILRDQPAAHVVEQDRAAIRLFDRLPQVQEILERLKLGGARDRAAGHGEIVAVVGADTPGVTQRG